MVQKKICMVGAFGVGKTSLVRQFVESLFDERYQTTIGVKIDKKVVEVSGQELTLIIWDLAGEDEGEELRLSYLRGASGYILVVDGCRVATLGRSISIRDRIEKEVGSIPYVIAINKADVRDEWELESGMLEELRRFRPPVFETSAKSGECVEAMFRELSARVIEKHREATP